jgi:hypothetical protein
MKEALYQWANVTHRESANLCKHHDLRRNVEVAGMASDFDDVN